MSVPVDIQFQLLKKILNYDRNFHTRSGDTIAIGVAYQKRYRTSLTTKDEFLRVTDEQTESKIGNLPVVYYALETGSVGELLNSLSENKIDILYLTPLRGIDIEQIASFCNTSGIFTFTGIPDYVSSGIIVGIDIKGESPQILINLTSAKEASVDFNSQLLKLSRIVH
ncbi:MAG: YfiR family protein [Ignavibacteriae bacterium]|nr:YfiR family protein [Ignavibacteriota bacterium]